MKICRRCHVKEIPRNLAICGSCKVTCCRCNKNPVKKNRLVCNDCRNEEFDTETMKAKAEVRIIMLEIESKIKKEIGIAPVNIN